MKKTRLALPCVNYYVSAFSFVSPLANTKLDAIYRSNVDVDAECEQTFRFNFLTLPCYMIVWNLTLQKRLASRYAT